ncbi:hypothetical protein HKD37_02G005535 [Glycine soja]
MNERKKAELKKLVPIGGDEGREKKTFVLSMGKSFFSYVIPINVVAYLFDLMYLLDLISLDEKVWWCDHALSAATPGLSEYGGDHALSVEFALNVPLSFFVGLLRAKLELVAKR